MDSSNRIIDFYDLSPIDFEKYCYKILKGYAEEERLKDFSIEHNKKIKVSDGKYQIDIYASFIALECEIKILCECKRYKNPVNRDKVVILHKKLDSLGAHKGILMTNNRFQSGAIQYAKEHGIALIQVSTRGPEYFSHSNGLDNYSEDDPFLYSEKMLPPYRAVLVTKDSNTDFVVYPTSTEIESIYKKMNQLVSEQYGLNIDIETLKKKE